MAKRVRIEQPCFWCDGTGKRVKGQAYHDPETGNCRKCEGTGVEYATRTLMLCIGGPNDREWHTEPWADNAGYTRYNRSYGRGVKGGHKAVLIYDGSLV